MNDIFISYDRNDRARAQKFADALESSGWSVWWDREIPLGKSFDLVIEEELNAASCVVVLWSADSILSRWVKTEAAAAFDRGRLVPVFIDRVTSPLEFRRTQAAELWDWTGDKADPEFQRLLQAVRQMIGQTGPVNEAFAGIPPRHTRPVLLAAPKWLIVTALAIILLGALVFAREELGKRSAKREASTVIPATGSPLSTGAAAVTDDGKVGALPNSFSIKVGDKIDDGVPGPGAGTIGKPYEQDQYVFNAKPGQRVYFRILGHSPGLSYINWRLVDASDMEVFNACLDCAEPGVQVLTRGGTYTLTVGSATNASTGTYRLQLFDVPPPGRFSVRIGDAIEDNKPAAGAGAIESPGAEDVYTFTAAPRQRVYFRMLGHSPGLSYINWRLTDANGMEVFNACLDCAEPAVQTLVQGGTYVLTLGNKSNPATGLYRLQLFNIPPPDQFAIKPGDRIGQGMPGSGAGAIESPGAEDIYVLTASPGQKVYFHLLDRSKGMDYINWRLQDDNGMEVFNACFACAEPGLQTLTRGGKYTLTVGNRANPSTGIYSLEIGSR